MDSIQAKKIIIKTFENPFDKSNFVIFLKNLLKSFEEKTFVYKGNYIPDAFEQYISSLERIGKYKYEGKEVDLLIVQLKKETLLERARTKQRNFIAWYLNGSRGGKLKDAALVAFVSPDSKDWRFSLVKMDYNFKEAPSGRIKIKEELTPARRWSFLVGKYEKSHTAQSRFIPILENDDKMPTLEDLEQAFNVEVVTKEFFQKYRDLFIRTKLELDKIVENDSKVRQEFENKNINAVDFARKLLGQITFLYFLQKKGWFGVEREKSWGTGPKDFIRRLYNKEFGNFKNFYDDILEPLFYEALRTDRSSADHYFSQFNCKIPFLNGGLFDPINNYDWVNTEILVSNSLFSNTNKTEEGDIGDGILDIFDRYNFTVNEEEPLEKEVALDPELLGKIYEKLNAIRADNFDEYLQALKSGRKGEELKFNKEYGVYYTPREIVHYMCQESLKNYLETELSFVIPNKADNLSDDIEKFIKISDSIQERELTSIIKQELIEKGKLKSTKYESKIPEYIRDNAKQIDNLLADIKVCDPAVGSGAFPVGMMHEIVKLRQLLSVYTGDKVEIYDLKRHAIESSLYGVDIDPGAVEICKLRFWLSMIVDEEDFYNIKPLPNLDYKIVCGNSLLGVVENIFNIGLFHQFEDLKILFFNETNPTKKQEYKRQIDGLVYQITNGNTEFDFKVYFSEVFHQKGGFDIVIANPPYIGEKGHKEIFREAKKGPLAKFYLGKMDYFYFFFHLALNIVRENGIIAFITTNYYPTAMGAKKLRQDFKLRSVIKDLINFNELKIFESALGQHNMITILQKEENKDEVAKTCITQNQGFATSETLKQILNGSDVATQYYEVNQRDLYDGGECYIRITGVGNSKISDNSIQKILDKIKTQGTNLGIICNVNQGIVTGADKVSKKHIEKYGIKAEVGDGIFVLSDDEVARLDLTSKEKEILKPWFKNSDIFRWRTSLATNEKLIYADKRLHNLKDNKLKDHLQKFKKILDNSTINSPYLHRPRDISFDSYKIVAPQRSPRNTFGYNEIPWYAASDVFFITEKDKSISLKYILALLNSKLYYIWLYYRGKRKGENLELIAKPLSEIPIKKILKDEQNPFIEFVDKIVSITKDEDYLKNPSKQAKVKEYELQIDQLIYKLYELTEDEIKIIENYT